MKRTARLSFLVCTCLVVLLTTSLGIARALPAGLVAWWPGDTNANDVSGNGHHATLLNGAQAGVPGLIGGGAFRFDGINDVAQTAVFLPQQGTIDLRVNPTTLTGTHGIIGTFGQANGNDRLWIGATGAGGGPGVGPNRLAVNLGSCCVNDIDISNPLALGTWTPLALTFDYLTDLYTLYVNGHAAGFSTAPRNGPTQHLSFGSLQSDFGQFFYWDGLMDEVHVFNRVLDASEILALANAPSASAVPEPSTWLLLATGCVGLLGYGWWRQKQAWLWPSFSAGMHVNTRERGVRMMNALTRYGVFILLCSMPLCGGCIKHDYNIVAPHLDATGSGPVAVVTHDQRPYVVSGGTDPSLVGLERAPAGVPYPVYTHSGRPLADEMTQIICRALSRKGFQCVSALVPASMGTDEVRRKLQEHPGAMGLVIVLHEWKSDTHTDTALAYDATLSVLDPHGVSLAETHIQGRDVLGDAAFWNVWGRGGRLAATAVPQALQKKLEELLNAPMIITALQTGKRPSSVPPQADQQPVALPPSVPQQREQPLEGSQRVLSQERTTKVAVVQLQHQYDAFRLFVQPATGAERLGSVSAGVPLKVIEEREQWLYIETPDERRGWILREWIQE